MPRILRGGLAILGRDVLDFVRMKRYLLKTVRKMNPFRRRRAFNYGKTGAPLFRRPDRPRDKTATTVWANVEELNIHTFRAKRAFKSTNPSRRGRWRQISVTAFAIRTQLKGHSGLPNLFWIVDNYRSGKRLRKGQKAIRFGLRFYRNRHFRISRTCDMRCTMATPWNPAHFDRRLNVCTVTAL